MKLEMAVIPQSGSMFAAGLLSASQVHAYYDRICLPQHWRLQPGQESRTVAADPSRGLEFLTKLQQHTMVSVPFENLDMHYNRYHDIFIDLPHLYYKIVERGHGRGGYCMETNTLFGAVLRSLGFDVYPAGARVYKGDSYGGWSHMVHIVSIQSTRYQVDVGFGTAGSVIPLLLDSSSQKPSINVPPQMKRLRRSGLPESSQKDKSEHLFWVYEVQNEPDADVPWTPIYCFTELEFLPSDFEVMNFYTSHSPRIFFLNEVVCSKNIIEGENIVGTISLHQRTLKRRVYGNKDVDLDLKTEEERVRALDLHLGITLTDDECAAIHGYPTELR